MPSTFPTAPPTSFSRGQYVDWTLEENQDRITPDVWLTRQDGYDPLYNYQWYLANNAGQDASSQQLLDDFNYQNDLTATGGTKDVLWAFLDDTGFTTNEKDYFNYDLVGALGNPANFLPFKAIVTYLYIAKEGKGIPASFRGDNIRQAGYWIMEDGTAEANTDYSSYNMLVGKNLAIYIPATGLYCKLVFDVYSMNYDGEVSYTRSGCSTNPGGPAPTPVRTT